MRLFVGLDLPDPVVRNVDALIAKLRPAADLRWSPAANLHITTKFIGEWPEARLGEMNQVLGQIHGHQPFEIELNGLGWFPNPHRPRNFWVAVRAGEALPNLARATDDAIASLGIKREDKKYSPHLTLARIKDNANVTALRQAIAALDSVEFGSFTATEYHLYLSELSPRGSKYTKLATFPIR
jgi:2'-5' RNA ligase